MRDIINEKVNSLKDELISLRRYFHKYPELGFQEHKTSAKIAQLLNEWGLEVKSGIGGTGVVGLIKGNKQGKTLGIRADIDALPIAEKTNLEFASEHNGIMHACGHDGHITIALGAAKVLSELKDFLPGNIKFIFQPAEEGPGGAKMMISEGVLENPSVDAIIGLHIWPEINSGYVGISNGAIMAAADRFDINIKGVGGHGAVPHKSVDPIVVGANIITAIQSIVSREIDPLDCAVISNCTFNGGQVFNVIPDEVTICGTVRTLTPHSREIIPKRMKAIVEGIANAMRCEAKFNYSYYYPATINNKEFTSFFEKVAKTTLGHNKVFEIERPSMGGEDFSFYLNEVQGTYFFLGTKNEEKNLTKSIHHPEYNIDEDVLPIGVKLFCNTATSYLNELED